MNAAIIRLMAVLISLAICLPLHSQSTSPEAGWNRGLAMQTIRNSDTQAQLKPLFQMARSGNSEALLDALSAIERNTAITAPVRDYLVFSFAVGLGDLDAYAVSMEVLDFLSVYEMQTMVAHDDHSRMIVPLFNVRAAASGVKNHWDRQQASTLAMNLMQKHPDLWLASYLSASSAQRRGFGDALGSATTEQLGALGLAALDRLHENPELTLIVAHAAMISGDFELLKESISRGSGPDLPLILKTASTRLRADERTELLSHALQLGSDTKAALAIAQLAPSQLGEQAVRELLFEMLSDPSLGASAAMVLGASADPKIQNRLREIASEKDGLAKQRAVLAVREENL